jgi:hypothetical protein
MFWARSRHVNRHGQTYHRGAPEGEGTPLPCASHQALGMVFSPPFPRPPCDPRHFSSACVEPICRQAPAARRTARLAGPVVVAVLLKPAATGSIGDGHYPTPNPSLLFHGPARCRVERSSSPRAVSEPSSTSATLTSSAPFVVRPSVPVTGSGQNSASGFDYPLSAMTSPLWVRAGLQPNLTVLTPKVTHALGATFPPR